MNDDIDAELDYRRIGQLLEYLAGRTQTFVTTSKESFAEEFGSLAAYFWSHEPSAESRPARLDHATLIANPIITSGS